MGGEVKVLDRDLQDMLADLEITPSRAKELTNALARSEARYDLWVRSSDFGSVVNRRRIKPTLSALNPETAGPLPVKSGRFAAGWNWKIHGLNATVSSQVPYAKWARKVGEDEGDGVKNVEKHLREDWDKVADEMSVAIAGWFL